MPGRPPHDDVLTIHHHSDPTRHDDAQHGSSARAQRDNVAHCPLETVERTPKWKNASSRRWRPTELEATEVQISKSEFREKLEARRGEIERAHRVPGVLDTSKAGAKI